MTKLDSLNARIDRTKRKLRGLYEERRELRKTLMKPKPSRVEINEINRRFADLYAAGKTYKQVGAEFGVSAARARERVLRHIRQIKYAFFEAWHKQGMAFEKLYDGTTGYVTPLAEFDFKGSQIRLISRVLPEAELLIPPLPLTEPTLRRIREFDQRVMSSLTEEQKTMIALAKMTVEERRRLRLQQLREAQKT